MNLEDRLSSLSSAVPAAPGFVNAVRRRLPPGPAARAAWEFRRPQLARAALPAVAASVMVAMGIAWFVLAGSPQEAFGEVVRRVERVEVVRYRVRSTHTTPGSAAETTVEYRSVSTDGRRRSEVASTAPGGGGVDRPVGAAAAAVIYIHNPRTSPDADLRLYPGRKIAEFIPVDAAREAAGDMDPVAELKKCAAHGVQAAPDEVYKGKPVRVYVSEKPEQIDGGRQSRTRRVLVDKATDLPVLIRVDGDMTKLGQGTHRMLMDSLDWNPRDDDRTFATTPPDGYAVRYDALRPLTHGLTAYASQFGGRLPDRVDGPALALLKGRTRAARAAGRADEVAGVEADVGWGFAVPAFAAKRHLDFRYYGRGQTLGGNSPPAPIVAVERAPGSGTYDVWLSDRSYAAYERLQLPAEAK